MVVRSHNPYLRRTPSISLTNHRSPPWDCVPHRRAVEPCPLHPVEAMDGGWIAEKGRAASWGHTRPSPPLSLSHILPAWVPRF